MNLITEISLVHNASGTSERHTGVMLSAPGGKSNQIHPSPIFFGEGGTRVLT